MQEPGIYGAGGGFSKSDGIEVAQGEAAAVLLALHCRAVSGSPGCFCQADDDNKNTSHLIKQGRETATKMQLELPPGLMMQAGISSGFKSRTREGVRANSTEQPASHELS